PQPRPRLLLQYPAEAAHHGALAGPDLRQAGEPVGAKQQQEQVHEVTHGHCPPPRAGSFGAPGPATGRDDELLPSGLGGLKSRSNRSRWVDKSSTLLLSPRICSYSFSFLRKA